ncbi:MAG TPA: bifunctional UDP-N-acetylglucosamine diphosphorylase/glucosamine-1-phosphate N-acetyltransferase GlmU [Candidatus Acidoferrum sp.]|jgi:bifunctional UDP-N-acetylglucosamine pyrophosphorylase/glucosamine-1-phosphate N-acetyltransferase|nr:bifunctional UDP-N-acetylglucosamine diphosphorylase/glucosamine-1-phosphate N-acetyltransferase GlmU [Candidatus Acidoferrum sp.]
MKKSRNASSSKIPPASAPRVAVAIMAAGKGTRLKSQLPKVLHEVGGKPLLAHVIAAATRVVPANDVFAIIGHEAERVSSALAHTGVNFVLQSEQRGTGHALMVARKALSAYDHVIVLSGDAPQITPQTIAQLLNSHLDEQAAMTLLSAELDNPTGYGRVLRKAASSAEIQAIVEEKSASPAQKQIREINAGFYVFAVPQLFSHIEELSTANPHGEYYITDMAEVLRQARQRVVVCKTDNPGEVLGANTRAELSFLDQQIRTRKCQQLMADGVTIFYPETCVIDNDVQIAPDTVIEPFVQILGKSRIGAACRIRSYSVIRDSEIGVGVLLRPGCILEEARIGPSAVLGPYSHLRPGSDIGEGAHVGNFVETKKIKLGRGSKANHLTYLGDTEIGAGVNIGAGTITCNYDGVNKHMTVIEEGVFIGSDSTLVAPVRVGKGAYVAAASCITSDVPPGALALGRARQIVKEGWADEKRAARQSTVADKKPHRKFLDEGP